jgi:hypothetical protein
LADPGAIAQDVDPLRRNPGEEDIRERGCVLLAPSGVGFIRPNDGGFVISGGMIDAVEECRLAGGIGEKPLRQGGEES